MYRWIHWLAVYDKKKKMFGSSAIWLLTLSSTSNKKISFQISLRIAGIEAWEILNEFPAEADEKKTNPSDLLWKSWRGKWSQKFLTYTHADCRLLFAFLWENFPPRSVWLAKIPILCAQRAWRASKQHSTAAPVRSLVLARSCEFEEVHYARAIIILNARLNIYYRKNICRIISLPMNYESSCSTHVATRDRGRILNYKLIRFVFRLLSQELQFLPIICHIFQETQERKGRQV